MSEIKKNLLLILSIVSSTIAFSQNINEKFAVEKICRLQKISKIKQEKLKWRDTEIYGEYENGIALIDGILKNDSLVKYFKNDDLIFVEKQYKNNINQSWETNFKKIKTLDSLTISELDKQALKSREMKYYYHSMSNPLFSLNGKFVIIKIDYYCGFMCSNQCIYLFIKKKKSWKLITEWNCLSS